MSLDEFQRLPEEDGYRLELERGVLVREPRPAPLHGRVMARLGWHLETHAASSGAGSVFADTGFILSEAPATVRGPDLAFVALDRIPKNAYAETGFWRFSPDLAVEIVSPSNTATSIQQKVFEYLDAGASLVWVVEPGTRTIMAYQRDGSVRVFGVRDTLDGGATLPGLAIPVADLFPG